MILGFLKSRWSSMSLVNSNPDPLCLARATTCVSLDLHKAPSSSLSGFGFDIVVGYPDNAPAPLRRLHPPEEIARPREFSKKGTSHHEPSFALRQPIEHQLSCPGLGRAKDLVPNIIVNDCTHGCLPAKGDNRFAVDSLGTGPFKGQLSAGSPP